MPVFTAAVLLSVMLLSAAATLLSRPSLALKKATTVA